MLRTSALAHKVSAKELQYFWDRFFSSKKYRKKAKTRILDGDAPGLELYLLGMVYGKPKEVVQIQNKGDGTFVLVVGNRAQAHVVADGEPNVITGTAEEVQRALPEVAGIVIDVEAQTEEQR